MVSSRGPNFIIVNGKRSERGNRRLGLVLFRASLVGRVACPVLFLQPWPTDRDRTRDAPGTFSGASSGLRGAEVGGPWRELTGGAANV